MTPTRRLGNPSRLVAVPVAASLVCVLVGALTACSITARALHADTFTPPAAAAAAAPAVPEDDLADFAVPVWVTTPRGMAPLTRERRLVTWAMSGDSDPVIRIMAPTTIRLAGAPPAQAPSDLHRYFVRLAESGAHVTEDRPLELDGVPAHRFTLIPTRTIPAGFGCWSQDPDDCFSLSPGRTLHVVTFAVQGEPVVLWSSTAAPAVDPNLPVVFDRMLTTVSFERWGRHAQHRASDPADTGGAGAADLRTGLRMHAVPSP